MLELVGFPVKRSVTCSWLPSSHERHVCVSDLGGRSAETQTGRHRPSCIVESRFACFSLYVDCCNLTFSDYMVPPLYLHSVSHKVCDVRRTPHSRWALPHSLRLTIRHAPHYTVSIGSDVGLLVHAHKHNPGRYMVGKRLACRMCAPRWRSRHRCRGGGGGDSRWRWRCLWNRRADCPPARRLAHHTNRCMSTCARRLSAGLSEAGLAALEPRLATSCSPT